MGRSGSDQNGLATKMTKKWGKENSSSEGARFCDSAVLSIRRVIYSHGKCVHGIECKLVTSLRRFLVAQNFLGSPEDPGGRARALQFALVMDSVLASMSCLLGKSEPPQHWLEWKMLLPQL